ncbi:hypothetical protein SCHPADRAFT_899929 [Schizopora paradoxa]|uniref:Uncharacterized protein n=1 Tax=Schizopora paradoxa TaxID=27342 RepID=A0A0H2S1U1_9AGAM|nr:hypothetical protein SCHPADRAFT_899929 [Schizopora paradoxa]
MSAESRLADSTSYPERESDIMIDANENDGLMTSHRSPVVDKKDNPFADIPHSSAYGESLLPGYESNSLGLISSQPNGVGANAMSAGGPPEEWFLVLQDVQSNINSLRALKGRTAGSNLLTKADSLFNTRIAPFAQSMLSKKHKGVPGARDVGENGLLSRQQEIRIHEELILAGMRRLAAIHPDSVQRAEWGLREAQFARALESGEGGSAALEAEKEKEKETILAGIAKGLGIIVVTPVILAGATLFGAGAIFYGTGKFLVGLGHMATCGKFR